MTELSRRQLLTTASGVGAVAAMSGTAAYAANAGEVMPSGHMMHSGFHRRSTPVSDAPLNVDGLQRVTQKLVRPPFVPDHDQIASGEPKVVQVRLVIEEKALVIDDDGTTVQAMTFNGSVPGPLIVVHQGDYVELEPIHLNRIRDSQTA